MLEKYPWWGNAMIITWGFFGIVVLALSIVIGIIWYRNHKK